MKRIILGLIMLSSASLTMAKDAADKFSNVSIETTKVRDGIYMLTGQGGNIGLSVGEDGVFMIDDQFSPLTKKIKAAIADLSKKPIRFIINTHWHFDHTGGNENHGKDGVVIVAHDNVRKRMSKDGFIKAFNKKIPASPKVALPIITFSEGVTFHINGQDISVKHQSNAHTDGDSIVFYGSSNVIHMGDTFFNGLYPFIDASSNGSVNGVIRSVDYILSIADDETQIIPGHGPLGNKKALVKYRHMLVTLRDRMQKLMSQGKSIEEIIASKPSADFDDVWGNGFLNPESFLKVLHSAMPKT